MKGVLKAVVVFGGLTALHWIVLNNCLEGDMNWFRFILCVYPIPIGIMMIPLLNYDNDKNNDHHNNDND